jgi:NADH-quinone oxidoreductase subunit N
MLFFKIYFPEIFLTFSTLLLLLFNTFLINQFKFKIPILNLEIFNQIFTIFLFLILLLTNISSFNIGLDFFFFTSFSTQNLKIFLITTTLVFFILIWRSFVLQKLNFFEYFIILLIILIGLLFLLNAYNLISIYLCLEIQALGFYILSAFDRSSIFSSEAGLKYFISSSLISGIFLLGTLLIYGSFGTLNLYNLEFLIINFFDTSNNISFFFFLLGLILILNTLLFKLVIAPFHFWFPQIYSGSPLSSTIFFTTIPKIVLINLFLQLWSILLKHFFFINTIYFLFGIYSVFWGILKMLKQYHLKKIYIYSSISNMGLLLCLLINFNFESTIVIYFFLFIYLITSFLLWFSLLIVNINTFKILNLNYPILITNFINLKTQHSLFAMTICFSFFSLAAIPPFCGFLSKTYIYLLILNNLHYEIAIFLIYLGTFGIYYYIKFLKIIFFETNSFKILQIHTFFFLPYFNLDSTFYSICLFLLFFISLKANFFSYFCSLFFF